MFTNQTLNKIDTAGEHEAEESGHSSLPIAVKTRLAEELGHGLSIVTAESAGIKPEDEAVTQDKNSHDPRIWSHRLPPCWLENDAATNELFVHGRLDQFNQSHGLRLGKSSAVDRDPIVTPPFIL